MTAAQRLLSARAGTRIASLPDDERPRDIAAAYAIQRDVIAARGRPVQGWKVGCTSPIAQRMLRYEKPFYGRLLDGLVHQSPAELDTRAFHIRLLEAEYAFRLGRDLPPSSRPYDRERVAEAVVAVHPAIEVVDTAFVDWLAVGTESLIADNGAHGAFILGQGTADWRGVELIEAPVTLAIEGGATVEGKGANVLGDPLAALAWLADAAGSEGGLRAGDLVTTGSAIPPQMVGPTARARATFAGLGSVSVAFV